MRSVGKGVDSLGGNNNDWRRREFGGKCSSWGDGQDTVTVIDRLSIIDHVHGYRVDAERWTMEVVMLCEWPREMIVDINCRDTRGAKMSSCRTSHVANLKYDCYQEGLEGCKVNYLDK